MQRKQNNTGVRYENRKSMTEKIQGFEVGSEVDMHLNSLGATLKKVPNWKTLEYDVFDGFWFLKSTSIHDR